MAGPKLATMAWRNLWRQKRRTFLTLASIMFGGLLAVIMTAGQDQSFADFIDEAARMGSGHVVVQHPDYLDSPALSRTVRDAEATRALALQAPHVQQVVARIAGEAMLATAHDSFGAAFIAYDPAREDERTLALTEGLVEGELYATAKDDGLVLGRVLARNLGAELGDKVVFTLLDKDGEIVTRLGRVSGIFTTGTTSADAALFLLPLDRAREMLGFGPAEATQVGVFLDDNRRSPEVAAALQPLLGSGSAALTWDEVAPDLRAFVAMKIGGGRFFLIVVALLVAAGIFNTLFISVMERLREFGILLALGYSPGQIFRLVMWESLWLSLVGIGLSALVTAGPYYYLHVNGIDLSAATGGQQAAEIGGVGFGMVMRFGIFPEHVVFIGLCTILATLAAGLYPAWKAGRVEPVETIKLV